MSWVNTSDFSPQQVLGCLLKDVPTLLLQLVTPNGWLRAKNRNEALSQDKASIGMRCDFKWGTSLHVIRVFPPTGAWLMRRAFAQWPVNFAPNAAKATCEQPELSFLIPFRGTERLPQLQATLRSILGQEGVRVECIVIEQSNTVEARDALTPGVRYVHLPHPHGDTGWHKSWAFNEAARHARASVLVCHDADIVVPSGYATALLKVLGRGYDCCHIQRFLFYLGPADSKHMIANGSLSGSVPELIRHNWVGGTLAIRKDAYWRIGGFDESWVDWGGEDVEFFDRCRELRQYRYGFVPFVHLWHPAQTNKSGNGREFALKRLDQMLGIPAALRIQQLKARQRPSDSRVQAETTN
jgi:hypothetical protein